MIKKVYDTIVTSLDVDVTVQNSFNVDDVCNLIAKIDTGATASYTIRYCKTIKSASIRFLYDRYS